MNSTKAVTDQTGVLVVLYEYRVFGEQLKQMEEILPEFDDTPWLYLNFDENEGTIASDSSGNGFNAELLGGGTLAGEGCKNGGVYFDGIDDELIIHNVPFETDQNFSISLWIKPQSLENTQVLIERGFYGYPIFMTLQTDGKIRTTIGYTGGTDFILSNASLEINRWYHVTLVINGLADAVALVTRQ